MMHDSASKRRSINLLSLSFASKLFSKKLLIKYNYKVGEQYTKSSDWLYDKEQLSSYIKVESYVLKMHIYIDLVLHFLCLA